MNAPADDAPHPTQARHSDRSAPGPGDPRIRCHLDRLLARRGMTLTELSRRIDISVVNLSVLKNDRAKAIRFSTLTAICLALDCTVGELLETDA